MIIKRRRRKNGEPGLIPLETFLESISLDFGRAPFLSKELLPFWQENAAWSYFFEKKVVYNRVHAYL